MGSSIFKVATATAGYCLLHSALASRQAKQLVEHAAGTRWRNAFYRPIYNIVALATTAALVVFIRRQRGRTIYQARGPLSWLMRLGQLAVLGFMLDTIVRVGPLRFAGVPNLLAWLLGRPAVPREPEGQSPPTDAQGHFTPGGSFRLTRHPANFFMMPLLWLNPKMTSNLATFNVVTTAYLYLGSIHTDRRMRQRYGPAYQSYRDEGIPLFAPRPVRRPQRGRESLIVKDS